MSTTNIIADISIPAEDFVLGQLLENASEASIRLEQIVPLQSDIIPLFWVSDGDEMNIESTLQDHPQIKDVQSLTDTADEELFEVQWHPGSNGIIQALIETNAWLLEAEGTAEEWEFRVRFPTHDEITAFNKIVTENGIPVTLRQLYNPTLPEEQSALSSKQRQAIEQAYRHGYFNVPRDSTTTDLADRMAISDSAYSQRLRRGLSTLVRETLMREDAASTSSDRSSN